mmetsp:Transcript_153618/g.492396  ORF Transcript_153618/g.492396 Transcript_153618/m.492396 type:complete len:355 (-) Transcript_153618:44-1108(-)
MKGSQQRLLCQRERDGLIVEAHLALRARLVRPMIRRLAGLEHVAACLEDLGTCQAPRSHANRQRHSCQLWRRPGSDRQALALALTCADSAPMHGARVPQDEVARTRRHNHTSACGEGVAGQRAEVSEASEALAAALEQQRPSLGAMRARHHLQAARLCGDVVQRHHALHARKVRLEEGVLINVQALGFGPPTRKRDADRGPEPPRLPDQQQVHGANEFALLPNAFESLAHTRQGPNHPRALSLCDVAVDVEAPLVQPPLTPRRQVVAPRRRHFFEGVPEKRASGLHLGNFGASPDDYEALFPQVGEPTGFVGRVEAPTRPARGGVSRIAAGKGTSDPHRPRGAIVGRHGAGRSA